MSLEQAILDRLEKRNEENARLQNIINDLERSADASSKQERETYDALVAYIQKMRAQIESDRLEREQMQHQITELRSERDRILEISKSSVPKSALKQAVLDAAGLSSEVARLRAEVPLEPTREALKNAVAKLQEVTTDRDRLQNELAAIYAEANKSGYCNGDPVAQIKKGKQDHDAVESMERQLEAYSSLSNARAQEIRKLMDGHAENMAELSVRYEEIAELHAWATGLIESGGFVDNYPIRTSHYRDIVARINSRPKRASLRDELEKLRANLQEVKTRADSLATCRDRWMKIAADCGRMDGEDAGEFMARLAQQSAQGVALAVKVEELRVVNIKQEQELEELRSAKSIAKNGIDESYQVKVLNQLGQTIAYKDRQLMVMVSMYKRIKACRDIEDRIAQMMSITSAIDDADNALSQLTA